MFGFRFGALTVCVYSSYGRTPRSLKTIGASHPNHVIRIGGWTLARCPEPPRESCPGASLDSIREFYNAGKVIKQRKSI